MTVRTAPTAPSTQEHLNPENPVVELRDVTVRLEGRTVLHNLSFSVRPGDFVGVIGPNGAGKSTLLKVLLGLIKPASGTVELFGRPAGRGNPRIGYVPQHQTFYQSMPLRARDMVALGIDGTRYGLVTPSRSKSERVMRALHEVRAESYADAPISRLSGGEQQRLMLAQALVGEPDLLLLDEPLANLDLRSRSEVVDLVCEVSQRRNIAVLFVAHDVNPLLGALDQVLYIANGRAVIGSVDEVVQSDVLTRLFGFPVHVIRTDDYVLVTSAEQGGDCHA
ncbi:MAG TPA: ATP-binding cassette domain-containing protein [Chloroflexota bacterium]|nr:ATP-binding cassette domain-containing protein [Chloroflexota bacterium]